MSADLPRSPEVSYSPEDLEFLRTGGFRVEGRMPWSSNATFLVSIGDGLETDPETEDDGTVDDCDEDDFDGDEDDIDEDDIDEDDCNEDDSSKDGSTSSEGQQSGLPLLPTGARRGIYKPHRGERPLWDFPSGLYRREVAAYELSAWLGWTVIPPTVLRDADYGLGSVQLFIDADFTRHYFTFLEDEGFHDQLRTMAVFDVVANNADRKGGHVLVDSGGHLWGIDQGLCFNVEPKLRTVIWDFAGEKIPAHLIPDLERLALASDDELGALTQLLMPDEREAMRVRTIRLLRTNELPAPRSDHAYPWPLV